MMTLSKGDVVLIRPMQPHQTRTLQDGPNQYIVLRFVPDGLFSSTQPIYELKYIFPFLYSHKQNVEFYAADQLSASRIESLLIDILNECTQKTYGHEMAVRAYTEQVLLWFIRNWHMRSNTTPMDADHLEAIKAVFQYIEEHVDEPLTVAQIASSFSMGRSTFSRFFSQYVGESLPSYIRRLRLTRAANALIQTNKTITEIAAENGFASTSYFTMCFREQNSMTPKQFRSNANRHDRAAAEDDSFIGNPGETRYADRVI